MQILYIISLTRWAIYIIEYAMVHMPYTDDKNIILSSSFEFQLNNRKKPEKPETRRLLNGLNELAIYYSFVSFFCDFLLSFFALMTFLHWVIEMLSVNTTKCGFRVPLDH